MSEQKINRKPIIVLGILLAISLLAVLGLLYFLLDTNEKLEQTSANLIEATAQQEVTVAALKTTEVTLAETQTALADVTAKQEATVATLTTTEATLAETQTALADVTAKQEATVATLTTTEATLAEAQTALADMTAKQEATAATLTTTEVTLAETQTALADMTAKQEATAATLIATEATLTETQTALTDMTAKQEETAAMLANTEKTLNDVRAEQSATKGQQISSVEAKNSVNDILLTELTFEDLVAFKSKIDLAIWEKEEWQEVTVPQGVWRVGEDIPAGQWTITCAPKWMFCSIEWGTTLNESGQGISWNSKRYDSAMIINPTNAYGMEGLAADSYTFEAKSGEYIIVSDGAAVFAPFTGKPSLGFK